MSQSWIQIGIVGKAHGLRGAFFVAQREEALPHGLKTIKVGPLPESARLLSLSECRRAGDRIVVQCSEITSRESAETLKMQPIWCERKFLPLESDSEYLWADLIGKEVLDAEAILFGHIKAVANFGASDIVRIVGPDGQWTEIPFVAYYFNMSFNADSKSISMVVAAETFAETWNKS